MISVKKLEKKLSKSLTLKKYFFLLLTTINIKKKQRFIFVNKIEDVLEFVLEKKPFIKEE